MDNDWAMGLKLWNQIEARSKQHEFENKFEN